MTDSQKLDMLLSEMQGMKSEMQDMKGEMQDMKGEMQDMKGEMQNMKGEIQDMKGEMQDMKGEMQKLDHRMTKLELHLENGTDRNIQLVAENFVELTKKLNQAIPVADKNLAYEVKVNYLIERVHELEEEMKKLKMQIA